MPTTILSFDYDPTIKRTLLFFLRLLLRGKQAQANHSRPQALVLNNFDPSPLLNAKEHVVHVISSLTSSVFGWWPFKSQTNSKFRLQRRWIQTKVTTLLHVFPDVKFVFGEAVETTTGQNPEIYSADSEEEYGGSWLEVKRKWFLFFYFVTVYVNIYQFFSDSQFKSNFYNILDIF